MSKIGRKPVIISEKVTVEVKDKQIVVSGSLGSLVLEIPEGLKVETRESLIEIVRKGEKKKQKMIHGTFRQLVANAVKGVDSGWSKELEVKGVGFRVRFEGEELILTLGFSHPVKVRPPEGIKFEVSENKIKVFGIDKAKVGLVADKIRRIYPPDPYKGKGIRYLGEKIVLKPGKAAKVGAGVAGG